MAERVLTVDRLGAKRREQVPQALARLVVVNLFAGLWLVLWLARMPMPVPFLLVLLAETAFFLAYWRAVFLLPSLRSLELAHYGMLAAEIVFHTTMVYFLGGISWLGAFAYVFGLIFTNTFLDLRKGLIYTSGASLAFTALIVLEATGTIPHYVYLEQGPLRYTDARFVATTAICGFGVFTSIYLWVNWVGSQLRRERDSAVRAQERLLQAQAELEARVKERTHELELANAALRGSEAQLRAVVSNVPVVLFALDAEGTFTVSEGKGLEALGLRSGEVVGQSVYDVYHDIPAIIDNIRQAFAGETFTATVELGELAFETHYAPMRDARGQVAGVIGVASDITERMRAETALRESETKFRAMAETVAAAVFIFQGTRMRYVNPMAEMVTGYTADELNAMDFWDVIHPDFRDIVRRRGMARQQGADVPPAYEVKLVTKSGDERWVHFTAGLIDFEGKPAVLGTAFDITDRKWAEQALQEQARRDPLTGLLNRRAGLAAMEERLQHAKNSRGRFATLVLDLDRFKRVNDSFGHEAGDAALLRLAQIMTDLTGARAICRLGGDEFQIGIEGAGLKEACAYAEDLLSSLRDSFGRKDAAFCPEFAVSIGIACFPEDGETTGELGRRADDAMYAAKAAGGDRYQAWRDLPSERVA